MVDACTIQHKTGETTNQETGVVTPAYATIYAGKCKIQRTIPRVTPTDVGQAEVYIGHVELHVPVSVTAASADDLATITASPLDPALVGRTYRLRLIPHKTFLTARRFGLIEVTS